MKIIQFYPESIDTDIYVTRLTFEPGGIFIKKDNKIYFNNEEITFMVASGYELARPGATYRLSEIGNESNFILVKADELNRQTDVRKLVIKSVAHLNTKMKESELKKLSDDLEAATIENMIDYALSTKNEELFVKTIEHKNKLTTIWYSEKNRWQEESLWTAWKIMNSSL